MRKIDSLFKTLYGGRVSTVEHVKSRESFLLAEGASKHFGAEAASAHPEKHHIGESVAADSLAECRELAGVLDQLIDYRDPPQRVGDDLLMSLVVLPEGRVFSPDAPDPRFAFHLFERRFHVVRVGAKLWLHSLEHSACDSGLLRGYAAGHRIERSHELGDAFVLKLLSHLLEVNTQFGEFRDCSASAVKIFFDRHFCLAVIAHGSVGRGRDSVDSIRGDQFINVISVRVGGVLGAGACPQRALHLRARCFQLRKAICRKGLFKALVEQPDVGDRGFAEQAGEQSLFAVIC